MINADNGMELVSCVQKPVEAVSLHANASGKDMKPFLPNYP